MKLHRSSFAALLLAPLAALGQETEFPHSAGPPSGDLLPGLSLGSVIARVSPPEFQALLPQEGGYRVVEMDGKWLHLEPIAGGAGDHHHSWLDSSKLSGYVVLELPPPAALQHRVDVVRCKANMSAIARGLLEYKAKYKRMPSGSGAQFLAALIGEAVWSNTAANARTLTCPSLPIEELPTLRGKSETDWFVSLAGVDEGSTAYYAWDTGRQPLPKFPVGESVILAACDHHEDGRGDRILIVLKGDMTVREISEDAFRETGVVGYRDSLRLGPDSQDPALRKLAPK